MTEKTLMIIDPPVGPFSPVMEIEAWIKELRSMDANDDVQRAIDEAEEWIKLRNDHAKRR